MAKLYLIWQDEVNGYDTYDSAVVVAESEEEARDMNPACRGEHAALYPHFIAWGETDTYSMWATKRESVRVKLLGEAEPLGFSGVVCASFNAG